MAEFTIPIEDLTPILTEYLSRFTAQPIDPATVEVVEWDTNDESELISLKVAAAVNPTNP